MELSHLITLFIFLRSLSSCNAANAKLFREYIGAESDAVKLSDMPVNASVEVHFILSFAIDYSAGAPSNGKFNIYWETKNLKPSDVASIKKTHSNVKVALSLGGASVGKEDVYFAPQSIFSWIQNAVSSLTSIIKLYNLDGIDIDYENFRSDPNTFTECIGQLVAILKNRKIISFASIAPYEDDHVQSHYLALWRRYGGLFDYVNFQFYAYDKGTGVDKFLRYYEQQASNYNGGNVLVSFISSGDGGLAPNKGFFEACNVLKKQGKLKGIFVWCADESKEDGFKYEKQSQNLLAAS